MVKVTWEIYNSMTNEDKQKWNWDYKNIRFNYFPSIKDFNLPIIFFSLILFFIFGSKQLGLDVKPMFDILKTFGILIKVYFVAIAIIVIVDLSIYSDKKSKEKKWLISKGYIQERY